MWPLACSLISSTMARIRKTNQERPIESYEHQDKQRVNNPPVGLVTPETD